MWTNAAFITKFNLPDKNFDIYHIYDWEENPLEKIQLVFTLKKIM